MNFHGIHSGNQIYVSTGVDPTGQGQAQATSQTTQPKVPNDGALSPTTANGTPTIPSTIPAFKVPVRLVSQNSTGSINNANLANGTKANLIFVNLLPQTSQLSAANAAISTVVNQSPSATGTNSTDGAELPSVVSSQILLRPMAFAFLAKGQSPRFPTMDASKTASVPSAPVQSSSVAETLPSVPNSTDVAKLTSVETKQFGQSLFKNRESSLLIMKQIERIKMGLSSTASDQSSSAAETLPSVPNSTDVAKLTSVDAKRFNKTPIKEMESSLLIKKQFERISNANNAVEVNQPNPDSSLTIPPVFVGASAKVDDPLAQPWERVDDADYDSLF